MSNNLLTEIVSSAGEGKLTNPHDRDALRSKISELETAMQAEADSLTASDIPLAHYFSPGVYAREIFLKKGTLIVGKIHKFTNMNIVSGGDVSFFSIDGALRVQAPHTFVASPGVKRVIYAHEDTTWTTIHGTEETDLKKIEEEFIAEEYDAVYEATDRTLQDVLNVLGLSADLLQAISENEADQMGFPGGDDWGTFKLSLKDSAIHGKGVFAEAELSDKAYIGPARLGGLRTPIGRYCNHSGEPNAKMVLDDQGDVGLIAIKDIKKGEEILTDYYYNYTNTRG